MTLVPVQFVIFGGLFQLIGTRVGVHKLSLSTLLTFFIVLIVYIVNDSEA